MQLGAGQYVFSGLGISGQIAKIIEVFARRLKGDGAGTVATGHALHAAYAQLRKLCGVNIPCGHLHGFEQGCAGGRQVARHIGRAAGGADDHFGDSGHKSVNSLSKISGQAVLGTPARGPGGAAAQRAFGVIKINNHGLRGASHWVRLIQRTTIG